MSAPILGDTVTYGAGLPAEVRTYAAIVAATSAQDSSITGDEAIVYVLDPQCARFERAPYSETPAVGHWTPRP